MGLGKIVKKAVSTSTLGLIGGQQNNLLSDTGSQTQTSSRNVEAANALEQRFSNEEAKLYDQLGLDIKSLAGVQAAGSDLSSQLAALAKNPFEASLSAADIEQGKKLAEAFTSEESLGLQQGYEQQVAEANRLATRLGRSTIDPILQAQLRKTVMQQQQQLGAKKTALSSQLALQNLQQRMAGREQQANLFTSALGAQGQQFGQSLQALQSQFNRASLAGNIVGREQQMRLGKAGGVTTSSGRAGFLDILGAGARIAGSVVKMGS